MAATTAELEKQETKVEKLRKSLRTTKEELSEKAKGIKKKWAAYNASQPVIEVTSMGISATASAALAVGIDKIAAKIGTKWQPLLDAVPLVMGGTAYGIASSSAELQPSGLARFGTAFAKDVATIALFKIEYGLFKMMGASRAATAALAAQNAELQQQLAAQQQPAK